MFQDMHREKNDEIDEAIQSGNIMSYLFPETISDDDYKAYTTKKVRSHDQADYIKEYKDEKGQTRWRNSELDRIKYRTQAMSADILPDGDQFFSDFIKQGQKWYNKKVNSPDELYSQMLDR